MKFVKGLVIGGLITTGAFMMCADDNNCSKKMIKKGKRLTKKWGLYK